jgi:hypothetical protein
MSTLLKKIEYNLKADFEVLSDYVFLQDELYYLSNPSFKPPVRNCRLKYLRSDHDGVCEAEGTPQLSYLHFKEMIGKENTEHFFESISKKPLEEKERIACEFLRENRVDVNKFILAGKRAVKEFKPVKNIFEFVHTVERKLSYYLDIRSGIFSEAFIGEKSFPGPLKIFWKILGLSPMQIGGSKAYFDENGILIKIEFELEHKKRRPVFGYLEYLIGFTDTPISDFPMVDVNINILPLIFSFDKIDDVPRGLIITCKEARKDMCEAIKPILKVERGIVEELGKVDIEKVEKIGKEIKKLYEIYSTEDLLKNKENFVNKSSDFLESLCFEIEGKNFSLFPEKFTQIRKKLILLKNSQDFEVCRELIEDVINLMKRYSAEFPK